MFQSSDDFNIDEDFLNDAFGVSDTNNEIVKHNFTNFPQPPIKKICIESENRKPLFKFPPNQLTSFPNKKRTENILDILSKNQPKRSAPDTNVPVHTSKTTERHRKVVQRKFPGPAGLLPEHKQFDINISTLEDCDNTNKNKTLEPQDIICSQLSNNVFKEGLWVQMLKDYYVDEIKLYLPEKYSIAWNRNKAYSKQLIGKKAPFLAAIIQSIDCSSKNPMVFLKDPTGEIRGTIYKEVWDEFAHLLHLGSVIVLRQVGVLTTLKHHYLNITADNLITIYSNGDYDVNSNAENCTATKSQSQHCENPEITHVQYLTSSDFLNSIKDVKRKYKNQITVDNPALDNPYLKSKVDNSSLNKSVFSGSNQNLPASHSLSASNVISSSVKNYRSFISKMVDRKKNETNIQNHIVNNSPLSLSANVIPSSLKDQSFINRMMNKKANVLNIQKPISHNNIKTVFGENNFLEPNSNIISSSVKENCLSSLLNWKHPMTPGNHFATDEVVKNKNMFQFIPAENSCQNSENSSPNISQSSSEMVEINTSTITKNIVSSSTASQDLFEDSDLLIGLEDSFLEEF